MADTRATVTLTNLRAADVAIGRYDYRPALYLELGNLVTVTLGLDPDAAALEAGAMRKVEQIAGELAAELERRAAGKAPGDG